MRCAIPRIRVMFTYTFCGEHSNKTNELMVFTTILIQHTKLEERQKKREREKEKNQHKMAIWTDLPKFVTFMVKYVLN